RLEAGHVGRALRGAADDVAPAGRVGKRLAGRRVDRRLILLDAGGGDRYGRGADAGETSHRPRIWLEVADRHRTGKQVAQRVAEGAGRQATVGSRRRREDDRSAAATSRSRRAGG